MNRKLWENLISLYGIQALNYVVPLIALPFLARILGPVHWGELAFAEAYAAYISLFVEYGFGLSATRDMAQLRENRLARSEILAGVIGAQILLGVASLITTVFLVDNVQVFSTCRPLLALAFLLGVVRAANPFWYFQGLERMPLVATVNVISSLAAVLGMLVCVQSPQDAWISLALRCGAAAISAAISFGVAYRDTPFIVPSLGHACLALRRGWSLFLFRSAVSLYTTANVLLLGVLAAPAVVAWFAGAEKISKAATGAVNPITQAFYPQINHLLAKDRTRAAQTARVSVVLTVGAGLAIGGATLIAAPALVRLLLGAGFAASIPVLRLLALLPPLIAGSNVLGIQWMLPLRLDREFNVIIILAGLINVLLAVELVPHWQQFGMAASAVFAEVFVTGAMILVLRRRRLVPWGTLHQQEATLA